jgi:Carboxypeptidase regulatory-like domain/TonB dependent receptor
MRTEHIITRAVSLLCCRAFYFVVCLLTFSNSYPSFAQTSTGGLRGQVIDPSGAAVVHADVIVASPEGKTVNGKTKNDGTYEFRGLTPGKYTVQVNAKGFAAYVSDSIDVTEGRIQSLNIPLAIAVEQQQVNVTDQSTAVDVNPSSNASSIVLSGQDLDALPDDPDELQSDLEALAGPSAGPNGGQMYIDGFTAGQLPPKSSIREIRINQNPFSAEYDKLGYGRIEIFTKPGTDNYHGQFFISGNSSAFNSMNPFVDEQPSYHSTQYSASVGGPLSKKASFFFDAQRRNINDQSIVSAIVLDPSLNPTPFSSAIPTRQTRTNIGPRVDYQITPNNNLTARYQYWHNTESNEDVGQFALASQGLDTSETEHTLQLSDTQIFGSKIVNETRFQYIRENNRQTPLSTDPTVAVMGAFTGGGNTQGVLTDQMDRYELQNYTSMSVGKHIVKFGGRLRAVHDVSTSNANFNGTFTFTSIASYQLAQQNLQSVPQTAGPSQFSITIGNPRSSVTVVDAGIYAQDDWRVRSNVTLSYGLRFESQNQIYDHADFAPRVSVSWGLGAKSKTVLRAGVGMFYDRFAEDLVLQSVRLNGITQQQFLVNAPSFYPNVSPVSQLAGAQTLPTIYQIAPKLRSPYILQSAVSVEHQFGRSANLAISYLNSRGFDQLLTRNINAPFPGTFDPANPASGVRPLGHIGNIYQYESEGIFRQNQLIINSNVRVGSKLSLFGYYTLNYANSDTSGASVFPSNQYNIMDDYGRATFATRHRLFLGGTIVLPYAFRLNPFIVASSGVPFNITLGQDLNGDSIYNDRPTFATDLTRPSVVVTRFGTLDTQPIPGQTLVPVNYGTGEARFTMNLRVSKTFGLGTKKAERAGSTDGGPGGPGGPGGRGHDRSGFGRAMGGPMNLGAATDRRYSLTFSAAVRNLFNNVNLAAPIGNLSSPLFGEANALAGGPFSSRAANRRIDLQATFNF